MSTPAEDHRAVFIQLVGELERGLALLDQEMRTRQYAAARESVLQLRVLVQVMDTTVPAVLGEARAQVKLCACGAVAERGRLTCWRHS